MLRPARSTIFAALDPPRSKGPLIATAEGRKTMRFGLSNIRAAVATARKRSCDADARHDIAYNARRYCDVLVPVMGPPQAAHVKEWPNGHAFSLVSGSAMGFAHAVRNDGFGTHSNRYTTQSSKMFHVKNFLGR